MYRYSVTQWIFGDEPLRQSLNRLKKYGYNGVELAGESKKIDTKLTKDLLNEYEMACSSICGIYTEKRNLSSDSNITRQNAIDYVKANIDLCVELESNVLIVVPSSVGITEPATSYEKSWDFALESVNQIAEYAMDSKVNLAIEALNRYETFLVNNLTLGKKFVEAINKSSVGLMADLFHMSIEERDNSEALMMIKDYLKHVHFADNTREGVGIGNTDFKSIMETLIKIGYEDYIAMEFLPRVSNPYVQASVSSENNLFDDFTKMSIENSKAIEKELL